MADFSAYARSRERIVRVCANAVDARELRLSVLDELRRLVGFDSYAFVLTDPETSVGIAPLAEVPVMSELPRLIRLKYLTEVNRWTRLGDPPVALLSEGELSRSLLWREVLAGYDVRDVASVVFRDRFGCWGFLDLWRSGAVDAFGVDEAAYLADIAAPVAGALRGCQANTFIAAPAGASRAGPLVLLLSSELALRGQTPETHEYLRVLVPPAPHSPPIPASAYNVAAQLLAVEAGIDSSPPFARVHLTNGLWLTVRAARIGKAEDGPGRDIAVTIERALPAERLAVFAKSCALSARETELLGHLVSGTDTREVAKRMYLSELTVQDHLKSIFSKTDTHSRRALLSRALG